MFPGCATLGTAPAGEELSRIQQSPQWDQVNSRFDNPTPDVLQALDSFEMKWSDIFERLFLKGERVPDEAMPQVRPDLAAFNKWFGEAQAIWFGHSSLLIRMAEKNILIDPVFSDRASPVPFVVGRFQDAAVTLSELPDIDYIVISHDHYDHLDMKTVQFFRDRRAEFIVPLGVGSHLRSWGIPDNRITELDWWENTVRGDLDFVATPAQHFSGRGLNDRNKTLWASWVIQDTDQTIYFSGDSGYGPHFKEVGEKYGPFDAAFLETGQYNMRWQAVHMLPEEAARAYFDLGAKMFVPIHWAMFELSTHTWYQPAVEISSHSRDHGINLVTPKLGEVFTINDAPQGLPWWEPWVDPRRPLEWYVEQVS